MTRDPSAGDPELVRLRTRDGAEVVGDLICAEWPWAGAVVCHPHPAYGGDRHNVVVDRIFRTLGAEGATVLRFEFRSGGGGASEQLDVLAGVDLVADRLGSAGPLWLVGYSFGADIALSVDDDRVAGWVAVAPPLRFGPGARAAGDSRPALAIAAEHDQYNPPDQLQRAVATWPAAAVTVVPGADHFLAGATHHVADTVLAWIRDQSGSQPAGGT